MTFQTARLKLTAWYLLIIMLVTGAFSLVIYQMYDAELTRIQNIQQARWERQALIQKYTINSVTLVPFDATVIEETERRLRYILLLINLSILIIAGVAGYFLAGRTLRPIQQMIDDQSRFITDASHELRTPITALKSEIEVNLRDSKMNLKQAKLLLRSNLEEVNHLQKLSDYLIRLAQHQTIEFPDELVDQPLYPLVDKAISKVNSLAKIKKIKLFNQVDDSLIYTNSDSFVELLVIFLDNAIKYSPDKTTVVINNHQTTTQQQINIIDQGVGIAKTEQAKIFERFYRSDKSRTKTIIEGYGLGLSIAKQIVNQLNGSIKLTSQPDKGSTFSLLFPRPS